MAKHERILVVKQLAKAYGGDPDKGWIFRDVDFALHKGRILAIIGPSGSGKTAMLRTIAGLEKHESGTIHFTYAKGPHQDLVSMTFEEPALLPWLTVEQNVKLALEHLNLPREAEERRIAEALSVVGMQGYEDVFPFELSKSMQRKASLARSLSVDPIVLLMDEPFDNLDPLSALALKEELLRLLSDEQPVEGVIFSTNSVETAVSTAHEILILGGEGGKPKAKIPVNVPFPRDLKSKTLQAYIDEVYEYLLD